MELDLRQWRAYAHGWPGKVILALLALLLALWVWSFVSGRPLAPWTLSQMPDLAATGDLPRLSAVMETDPALRARVRTLGEKDEGWLFVNYREADKEVAAILLMWAGADMARGGKTPEGIDRRIDIFLRKIYGMGPDDFLTGDPLVGDKPWVRWFLHFKPRLLIQMAAMRVYDGDVSYDPVRDAMAIDARLSPAFMKGFLDFVEEQDNPAPYINNLLAFIDSTAGLDNLSAKDKERIDALYKLRKQ